jgi:hypothetical protein
MLKFNKEIETIYFDGKYPVYSDFHRKQVGTDYDSVNFFEGYDGLHIHTKLNLKRLITWLQDVYENCEDV